MATALPGEHGNTRRGCSGQVATNGSWFLIGSSPAHSRCFLRGYSSAGQSSAIQDTARPFHKEWQISFVIGTLE